MKKKKRIFSAWRANTKDQIVKSLTQIIDFILIPGFTNYSTLWRSSSDEEGQVCSVEGCSFILIEHLLSERE